MKRLLSRNSGFTLVEVLVALIILSVGLLSMATLMMASLQTSQSAYMRSQASLLTYDIVERMRANYDQATTTGAYVLARLAQQYDTCKALLTEGPIDSKLGAVLIPTGGVPVSLANSL